MTPLAGLDLARASPTSRAARPLDVHRCHGQLQQRRAARSAIVISKADADCTVNGFTGPYDGAAHGATGTCKGVDGRRCSAGLDLGRASPTSRAAPPTGRSPMSPATTTTTSGSVAIVISRADADAARSTASPVPMTAPRTAPRGTATGVDGATCSAGLDLGASFTNVPGGTANWTFTDVTGNYNNTSGIGQHRDQQG